MINKTQLSNKKYIEHNTLRSIIIDTHTSAERGKSSGFFDLIDLIVETGEKNELNNTVNIYIFINVVWHSSKNIHY